MKKIIWILFFLNINTMVYGSTKENIINNLNHLQNLSFNFEQNINGKIETGECVIEYPKKINCTYNIVNKKILVSNGKSLVIKNKNGNYYRYPIQRTPLEYILDKNFLINEIKKMNERIIDDRFINFTIFKDENEINIFFDINNYDLIGWQTLDIYQNLSITYLSKLKKNIVLKKNIFKLPLPN